MSRRIPSYRTVTVVYTLNGRPAGSQTLRLRSRCKDRHAHKGPREVKHLDKWWLVEDDDDNPTINVAVWKPNVYFELPESELPEMLTKQALAPV